MLLLLLPLLPAPRPRPLMLAASSGVPAGLGAVRGAAVVAAGADADELCPTAAAVLLDAGMLAVFGPPEVAVGAAAVGLLPALLPVLVPAPAPLLLLALLLAAAAGLDSSSLLAAQLPSAPGPWNSRREAVESTRDAVVPMHFSRAAGEKPPR